MKKKYGILLLALLLLSIGWNVYWNRNIIVHTYTCASAELPQEFDGFRIVQLTDIHSVRNERQYSLILDKTKGEEPDIICITGDLVDSRYYAANGVEGEALTLRLLEELTEIAPVYYVYGNHEMMLLDDPEKNAFKVSTEALGVSIINNQDVVLTREGAAVHLAGIQDPSTLYKDYRYAFLDTNEEKMEAMLDEVTQKISNQEFCILLSHRPEYLDLYDQYPVDLALTGHAHGGQFRIPFIGGVYAPGQGFFPEYTVGLYATADMEMYVCAGIGNSVIPFRIFNPPEILTIILEAEEGEG